MTSKPGSWVLVTDGGNGQSRSALAAVQALGLGGLRAAVTESTARRSLAGASRWCSRIVAVPAVDDPSYASAVEAELARNRYVGVLASSDAALVALRQPGAALTDKRELARRVAAAGMPAVPTQEFPDIAAVSAAAGALDYPVVVKPAVVRFPAVRIDRPDQLSSLPAHAGPVLVQPFLTAALRAVAGVVRDGRLVAAVHQRYLRTWPVGCGTASAAETVSPDEALEAGLLAVLKGYDGIFQAQLAGDYLLDLNPRVYGSLPLAVAAGANLPVIAVDPAPGDGIVRGRPGVSYRWLEGDVRHVWQERRAGRLTTADMARALRPRRHTAHSVVSTRDPLPALARVRYALGSRQ